VTRTRALLIAAAACSVARTAAADCTRPTGPRGDALGYAYGSAAVQSFGNASVRVWYTTEGPHAVNAASSRSDGVPDDVAEVAQVTSDALASYAAMGYRPPVSDAATPACGDDGGDGRLDVYLVQMTGGDGTTVAESGRCTAAGAAAACASYILARANFAGLYPSADLGIHTVLPHEAFHTVQNAYDAAVDRFWAEGTAQWAANRLDPSLTDLERFLPAFFSQTARSLDAPANGVTSAFLYGAAIWPVFLTQRHGDDIVRAIFDQEAAGDPALAATDVALAARQSAMATEYPAFAAWNAATGTRAGAGGYPEAAMYPMVTVAELTGGRAQGITSGFASYYFHVAVQTRAMVSLDTVATRNAGTLIPLVDGVAQLDAAAPLPATLAAGEAIVVVSGATVNKTDAPFTVAVGSGEGGGGCATGARAEPCVGLAVLFLLMRRSVLRRARTYRLRGRPTLLPSSRKLASAAAICSASFFDLPTARAHSSVPIVTATTNRLS
jgi:hypothetical protein